MDKLSNSEDAKRLLQGLGLHIDEAVVRQVANVLSGKAHQSLYSLYATRPDKPAPVCGKGSVYKIKKLYDEGELQPYLDYLRGESVIPPEKFIAVEKPSDGHPTSPTLSVQLLSELKAQLFTPRPEYVLIDDLGHPGDNSCRLSKESLTMVIENLAQRTGYKATSATTAWGASLPAENEVFWKVYPDGSVERYCPIERDLSFQFWFASVQTKLSQELISWKRLSGSYIAGCRNTRMEIHQDAKNRTPAGVIENLIQIGPRFFSPPPEPMTISFGDVVYQLAIEYRRSSGTRGVPERSSYVTLRANPPIFFKLLLGQAKIHLATTVVGLVDTWAEIHRRMIMEWGESKQISMLVDSFNNLQRIEETIKKQLN